MMLLNVAFYAVFFLFTLFCLIFVILLTNNPKNTGGNIMKMKELKETLQTGDCTLAVLHDGNIRTYKGKGIRFLYNIINEEPEIFLGAKVAVKMVGGTAAKTMIDGGVTEVYAEMISEWALARLEDSNIKLSYDRVVSHTDFLTIWEKLGEELENNY